MTTSTIQYNSRRKFHKPMRKFLRTQGPFVKSASIFDAWMRLHPKFYRNGTDLMRKMMIGRVLSDLLPRYSASGHTSGGCRNGIVFVNVYCRKEGIEVCEGVVVG